MPKSKMNKLKKEAARNLYKAFDIIEGLYSNIPQCCINEYLEGRTYMNVRNSLDEKGKKKLEKYNYVPCEKCLKQNKINKIKEGISLEGRIIFSLIDSIEGEF